MLQALLDDVQRPTGGAISAAAWLGGAIRVAVADDALADRILDAVPDTGRGGKRPGAGRPRGSEISQKGVPDHGTERRAQEDDQDDN